MAGLVTTETGNELSQPKFYFTHLLMTIIVSARLRDSTVWPRGELMHPRIYISAISSGICKQRKFTKVGQFYDFLPILISCTKIRNGRIWLIFQSYEICQFRTTTTSLT